MELRRHELYILVNDYMNALDNLRYSDHRPETSKQFLHSQYRKEIQRQRVLVTTKVPSATT